MKAFVAARTKRLLVVEDNDIERQSIVELLESDDIEITTAGTGWEAYSLLLIAPSIVACSISDFPI
jgi:CheY-like chemotaxis protein